MGGEAHCPSELTLYIVGKVLGHIRPTTTQRYAHLDEQALLAAVNTSSSKRPRNPLTLRGHCRGRLGNSRRFTQKEGATKTPSKFDFNLRCRSI